MSTSLSNALSGLKANAFAIEVVSGNLANLNTSGYKGNNVSFQDLVNSSLNAGVGGGSSAAGGSTIAQASRAFGQGALQTTGQPFDAAIEGDGFFVVRGRAGQAYSRAGNFKLDSAGHLLTQDGQFVQGWNSTQGTLSTNAGISDLIVPTTGLRQPAPTANFSITANLNSSATSGAPSGTFSSPMPVVDSLGASHVLTVTYTKTGAGTWDYAVTMPSSELTSGTGTSTNLTSGTLTFDAAGHLLSPAATSGALPIPITGLTNGAGDLTVNWSFYDEAGNATFTQINQASANFGSTQDGRASGVLTGMRIGANGQILAHYSNGDSVAVAQLAVASILNPDSMRDLGGNTFGLTSNTALPAIGVPGSGSRGDITGGVVESSTVDIAKEFTNLLTYERAYQANSKVITTQDDILQQTVNIKR
jgi:flagellar hook protein FlgE